MDVVVRQSFFQQTKTGCCRNLFLLDAQSEYNLDLLIQEGGIPNKA